MTAEYFDIGLIQEKHPYERALFANREREVEMVAKKLSAIQGGGTVSEPIINFWGVRGIGKTWLLKHLYDEYEYHAATPARAGWKPTFTLYYEFTDDATSAALSTVVKQLATDTLKQLPARVVLDDEPIRLRHASDMGDVDDFTGAMQTLSRRIVPLILMDNTEKVASQADWEILERQLIELLVSYNRIVVVVAGRRQAPRWRRFEVRQRVMEPEKSVMRAFDKQAVVEQLQKGKYPIRADLLFPYTAGNPLLVEAIARHIIAWNEGVAGGEAPDEHLLEQHQPELLRLLGEAEAEFLKKVPDTLKPVLNAVSPLRFYRLEALRFMLTRQHPTAEKLPDVYFLNTVRMLEQQTEVVWWERVPRAYVTNEVVRRLINHRQLLENPEEFATRHHWALEMYWNWVSEYPEASEDFIVEIWFHLASLQTANKDSKSLWSESHRILDFTRGKLNADRLLILQHSLVEKHGDRELLDLLPPDLSADLLRELEQMLNGKSNV